MILFRKSESISKRLIISNQTELKRWLVEIADKHHHKIKSLNYLFCSDEEILEANNQYLNHDYYTDIITFDLSEKETVVEGDILISIDTVFSNAESHKVMFEFEMARVVSHGLLHLLGYNDKKRGDIERMREEEDRAINGLFHVKQPRGVFKIKSST